MDLPERLLGHSIIGKNNCSIPPSNAEKWWASLVMGILFALFSCGMMYGISHGFVGSFASTHSSDGGPTFFGLFLHTVIFILVVRLILL